MKGPSISASCRAGARTGWRWPLFRIAAAQAVPPTRYPRTSQPAARPHTRAPHTKGPGHRPCLNPEPQTLNITRENLDITRDADLAILGRVAKDGPQHLLGLLQRHFDVLLCEVQRRLGSRLIHWRAALPQTAGRTKGQGVNHRDRERSQT